MSYFFCYNSATGWGWGCEFSTTRNVLEKRILLSASDSYNLSNRDTIDTQNVDGTCETVLRCAKWKSIETRVSRVIFVQDLFPGRSRQIAGFVTQRPSATLNPVIPRVACVYAIRARRLAFSGPWRICEILSPSGFSNDTCHPDYRYSLETQQSVAKHLRAHIL